MKVALNVPNNYGSDADTVAAIEDCYGGSKKKASADRRSVFKALAAAAMADGCHELYKVLAAAATSAGLRYIEDTCVGAIWEGTDEQFQTCRAALPAWARPYASPVGQ